MKLPRPIAKQFKVAAYSSPAISALTVTPLFLLRNIPFELYPWTFGIAALLVFIFWTVNIGIYRMVSRDARDRNRVRYLASYAFCILFSFFLFHDLFQEHFGSSRSGLHFHVIIFFAVDTVILILQDLVVTREKNVRIELENSRLHMRDMEAMNLKLAQQVHPHFLFNSLSTLKALISVAPEQATEYLVRLSGFLRSSMTDKGVVRVGRELELCGDYLAMQQIRFGEALRYSIEVPEEVRGAYFVPVFSVQLLIENAIKHNVLTPDRPLSIDIVYRDGVITVNNNLQRKAAGSAGNASGLINLRERYQALGGDPVRIEETTDLFSVSIKLLIHEYGDH
ncbi:MAG TPA: histidine kinase [Puia sp.]|jgi:sensor histidine kinase YesM|nr:histidine kinase [Puia sp.]